MNNIQELLYIFVPNKSFGQLSKILPTNLIYLKTLNSEFFSIEVWFTDQLTAMGFKPTTT